MFVHRPHDPWTMAGSVSVGKRMRGMWSATIDEALLTVAVGVKRSNSRFSAICRSLCVGARVFVRDLRKMGFS